MGIYVIPKTVKEAIERIPSRSQNRYIAISSAIYQTYLQEEHEFSEFVYFPLTYFAKVIKSSVKTASKTISDLKTFGVIESTEFYIPPTAGRQGKCKKYRILQKHLTDGEILQAVLVKKDVDGHKYTKLEIEAREMLSKITLPSQAPSYFDSIALNYAEGRVNTEIRQKSVRRLENASQGYLIEKGHVCTKVTKEEIERLTDQGYQIYKYQAKTFVASNFEALRSHLISRRAKIYKSQLLQINSCGIAASARRNATNRRLDSTLTNMASSFLALISIKGCEGERIKSLDLVNSQFVIFAAQLKKHIEIFQTNFDLRPKIYLDNYNISKEGGTLKGGAPEHGILQDSLVFSLSSGIEKKKKKKERKSPEIKHQEPLLSYMFTFLGELPENQREKQFSEALEFCAFCESGNLYENVASMMLFGRKYDLLEEEEKVLCRESRKQAKKALFSLFFGRYNAKDPMRDKLKSLFPVVVDLVNFMKKSEHKSLKRQYQEDRKLFMVKYSSEIDRLTRKSGSVQMNKILYLLANNSFAIWLQQIESEIFIDGIFKDLVRKKIWSASKHDSIIFLESDQKEVTEVMRKHLDLKLGNYQLKNEVISDNPESLLKI